MMKMPGLPPQQNNQNQFTNGSVTSFWSKHRHDISYNQLHKFWSELSIQERQELLRIDKQALFEQARKNMYCSRCNGLLLEGFLQIVMYAKSLSLEGGNGHLTHTIRQGALKGKDDSDLDLKTVCQDEVHDPSVHPWGGLTTTKDGILTLLDCYLYAKSLKGLQIVFDSARARERERELLYPDACGGGGRGWISHGISGYGRGHGTRETCALHTARLSVDTLVDFWSALGEETRQSLLRMKEEDFIERLMYRFDSKRFCRDCRRNVIREFKELKELKRMRKEPRCTSWFCVADTAFQYEVSHESVQADWHQTFVDNIGIYHHFEWAVGTGEGKSDILEFENVGMSGRVQVSGLDLGGLTACYITLRAFKMDGRCSEFTVKAHALKGQHCVHGRLVVGDGFVTITRGESIRRFFEHAEEAEEEEDDDSMDKDGNDLDGECSRPQKHAKSPELAREFLLDAATVIFKEQVEKAFREGTARQNAHSIFVCLALKLLEERVHVACKEIITLEKQMKLLEEEEKEKREEEERKERRRTKEREKKLRRKERLRVKEKDREKKSSVSSESPDASNVLDDDEDGEENSPISCEQLKAIVDVDSVSGLADCPSRPLSPSIQDEQLLNDSIISEMECHSDEDPDGDLFKFKDDSDSYPVDHSKVSHRKPKYQKECWSETSRYTVVSEARGVEPRHHCDGFDTYSQSSNGWNKQLRSNPTKSNTRNNGPKFGERFHYANNRMIDRSDFNSCSSCNRHSDYRPKGETHDASKQYYRVSKYNQIDYTRENCVRPKSKVLTGNNTYNRESPHIKKVWEPTDSLRKHPRSNSDTDVLSQTSSFKTESGVSDKIIELSGASPSDELSEELHNTSHKENDLKEVQFSKDTVNDNIEICPAIVSSLSGTKVKPMSVSSTSDNCSSCLSEGDSNASSSSSPNPESSSDSEDASQHSQGKESPLRVEKVFPEFQEPKIEKNEIVKEVEVIRSSTVPEHLTEKANYSHDVPTNPTHNINNMRPNVNMNSQYPGMIPSMHNHGMPFQMYQAPPSAMNYYHQSPVSWGPPAHTNGILPFHPQSHYVFPSPFEYGMNMDPNFMQYGAHQHPTPLMNAGQVPIYRPVVKTNEINSKDQPVSLKTCGAQESFGKVGASETLPSGNYAPNGNSKKSHGGNSGFSLFHFGSPVALPAENQSNPRVPCKNGIVEDEHNNACNDNKKDPIEEYNLFAASNGMRFSFF